MHIIYSWKNVTQNQINTNKLVCIHVLTNALDKVPKYHDNRNASVYFPDTSVSDTYQYLYFSPVMNHYSYLYKQQYENNKIGN